MRGPELCQLTGREGGMMREAVAVVLPQLKVSWKKQKKKTHLNAVAQTEVVGT
jgi:hypothetical protein